MSPLVMSSVLCSPQVSSWLCLSESRCDKDLDTLSGYALCLPNLARLQTYRFAEHRPILCVEIKVSLCPGEGGAGQATRGRTVRPRVFCQEWTLQHELLGFPTLGLTAPSQRPAPTDWACFQLLLSPAPWCSASSHWPDRSI